MIYNYEYINKFVSYNCETGELFWKPRPIIYYQLYSQWKRFQSRLGIPIGSVTSSGYRNIHLPNGKSYYAHIVGWVLHNRENRNTNDLFNLDHINGNKIDNRISNLRLVTPSINNKNVIQKNLMRNVNWRKREQKWVVRVTNLKGKRESLGYYDDKEEAMKVRDDYENKWGYTNRVDNKTD